MKKNDVNNVAFSLSNVKKILLGLNDQIRSWQHTDRTVSYFVGKVKNSSLQSLDAISSLEKQIDLLQNQLRSFEQQESRRKK